MNYDEFFTIEQSSGALIWKERPRSMFKSNRACNAWNARFPGTRAGSISKDGRGRPAAAVRIFNRMHYVHRVVFFLTHGRHAKLVDHIDGNGLNNNPSNLREASINQNQHNRSVQRTSRSGVKGAMWSSQCSSWYSEIKANGKKHWLGLHLTKGLAAVAYAKASLRHHGQYSSYASRTPKKQSHR